MQSLVPTVCASCAELLVSPAITEPHENMALRHQFERSGHDRDGEYICLECESIWELHFEDSLLAQARLVDHKGTRTSSLIAACPQPYHGTSRPALCQAVQWPRRGVHLVIYA